MIARSFEAEVGQGERFAFGKNWQRFLRVLDDERVSLAERSLTEGLGAPSLAGRSFLDVGSGSGLFSLAAMRLGASRVHSLDYDPQSVACARELRARWFPNDARWTASRGSALDEPGLARLGPWDIVYSWGVLHHTGNLWRALGLVTRRVAPGGQLFISIYNDQGRASRFWRRVKVLYNRNAVSRAAVWASFIPYWVATSLAVDALDGRNPLARYREWSRQRRGMSVVHDWIDWLGGLPFEVASPEAVFSACREQGFILEKLRTRRGGLGCNEFVFRRG